MPEETRTTVDHHQHHQTKQSDEDLISERPFTPSCRINSVGEETTRVRQSDASSMTLRAPLLNVIVLEVGGGNKECGDQSTDYTNKEDEQHQLFSSHTDVIENTNTNTEIDNDNQSNTYTLHLTDWEFNNAYNLFKVHSRAINTGRRTVNSGLLILDGSLVNLKELHLTGLTIGNETFDMIACHFPSLTRLTVSNCKTLDDDHQRHYPNVLESHYGLEELNVHDVNLADENFRQILSSLNVLRILKLSYCNVGNETMEAIFTRLTQLTCLDVIPSRSDDEVAITDEAFPALGVDYRLNISELSLYNVQFTDIGVQRIVCCMHNLSKLKVSLANIGDDTVRMVTTLVQLRVLELRGTHITDDGFKHLVTHLGEHLEELYLESGSITESGLVEALLPTQTPNLINLVIDVSESTKRLCYQGENSSTSSLQMTLSRSDFMHDLARKFPDMDMLTISCDSSLSASLIEYVAPFQSKLTSMFLTGSSIDDTIAMAVIKCFPKLHKLSLYESSVSGEIISELVHKMSDLEELNIETKVFAKSETIVKMVPHLKRIAFYHIYDNREQQTGQLMASNGDQGVTDLKLGGQSINDDVLLEFLNQYEVVERLRLKDTSVTDEGIIQSASNLKANKELVLVSEGIGDDAIKCIGNCLPQLKELTIKSSKVTDEGFASFSENLVVNLEMLDVSESSITDDGIHKLVPRLKSIKSLSILDNPNVNEGIREFLHRLLPDMGFIVTQQSNTGESDVELEQSSENPLMSLFDTST